jgi:hypothetical protein
MQEDQPMKNASKTPMIKDLTDAAQIRSRKLGTILRHLDITSEWHASC